MMRCESVKNTRTENIIRARGSRYAVVIKTGEGGGGFFASEFKLEIYGKGWDG